jgi:hypothetical protein
METFKRAAHFWLTAKLAADIAIATPHQTVQQIDRISFSKRRLLAFEKADDKVKEKAEDKLVRLWQPRTTR